MEIQQMRLINGKVLADEILGEIFERGQASGLWEQQLEIGALTYADIEYAEGYDSALEDVYRRISDMPTVDAVPVIRCKDCSYYKKNGMCLAFMFYPRNDNFCSLAERRE